MEPFAGCFRVATSSQHWLRDSRVFFTVPGSQCREKAASDRELVDGGRKTSCESMASDIVKSPYFPPARLQLVTFQMDTVSAFDILDQK